MFDQTPVPGPQERSARIPDADRYWISAGASWLLSPAITIDLAYSHLFFADADIDRSIDLAPQTVPGVFTDTLKGRFDNGVDGLAIEFRYRF
jgi:long-chain fatty acid transport protein